MALILIAETGAGITGANSYATLAQANAYHEARLHAAAWDAADSPTKEKALVMATRHLDASVEWLGERITLEQPLAWPRTGIEWQGFEPPDDWMPQQVVDATSELARLLIESDLQADQTGDGVAKLGLGSGALEIEFKDGNKTRRIPLTIGEMLQGIGVTATGGGINQRKTIR